MSHDIPTRVDGSRYEGQPKATIKDYLIYRHLLISPSYHQAHLYKMTGGDRPYPNERIPDLEKVLRVYEIVGDVFSRPFEVWWEKSWKQVSERKEQDSITIDLGYSLSRKQFIDIFKKKLDAYLESLDWPIEIRAKGPHESSMIERLAIVEAMAIFPALYPDVQLQKWKVAVAFNLSEEYAQGLTLTSELTEHNRLDRNYLDIQVHRALKAALNTAENAARGRIFDAKDVAGLPFDYELIFEQIYKNHHLDLKLAWNDRSGLEYLVPGETRKLVLQKFDAVGTISREEVHEAFDAYMQKRRRESIKRSMSMARQKRKNTHE
jgi:hypothetical protein